MPTRHNGPVSSNVSHQKPGPSPIHSHKMNSRHQNAALTRLVSLVRPRAWLLFVAIGALFINQNSSAEEDPGIAYRCPGPPVVYTDKITKEEAAARKCRSIEGSPITVVPTPKPPPSRWLTVGFGRTVQVLVDSHSIRRNGSKVSIWTNWRYQEPVDTTTIYPKGTYLSSKNHITYNCKARTSFTSQSTRYSNLEGGDVVESLNWPDKPENHRDITPETVGESLFDYACQSK